LSAFKLIESIRRPTPRNAKTGAAQGISGQKSATRAALWHVRRMRDEAWLGWSIIGR